MWLADSWKDYEVLDTSAGEKLERWGKYILVRPDPQVIWNTPKDDPAHGFFAHFGVMQTVCHGHRKRIHRQTYAQQGTVEEKHKAPFHLVCLLFVDRIPNNTKTRSRARCTSGTG